MKRLFILALLSLGIQSLYADTHTGGTVANLILITSGAVDRTRNWIDKINDNAQEISDGLDTLNTSISNSQTDYNSKFNAVSASTANLTSRLTNLEFSTQTVWIDMSGFNRVSHSSYSTDMTVSTAGLFQFDASASTGNWMATWVHFPSTERSYDVVLSSFVVGSTGTLTGDMNFTMWIATFASKGNLVTPDYLRPVNFPVTDDITSGNGVSVAQNITLTNWKTELNGYDRWCLIKITETTDSNTVCPFFIGATFKIIGYKQ